jgi:hypothetical protein
MWLLFSMVEMEVMSNYATLYKDSLDKSGFACLPDYVDEQCCDALCILLKPYLSVPESSKDIEYARSILTSDSHIRELLEKSKVIDLFKSLHCTPFEFVLDECVVKLPNETRSFPWHQDFAYFQKENAITTMIVLSDTQPSQPGIAIVPGSHKRGGIPHIDSESGLTIKDRGLIHGENEITFERGSVLLLHSAVIHRALTNRSRIPVSCYTLVTAPSRC